ncbi:MAG TPA: hypothetical protein VMB50_03535 [Myxococcales bacterium]|nr:hypothetical protein [Myxococcales bacterium]
MATIATQSKGVNASQLETELTEMDAGVVKDIPAKTSLTINGSGMTGNQIDTQIKSYLATIQAADAAKQQYQTALVARRNIQLEARDFYLQLKKAVVAFFGAQSAQLGDFGLKPAKPKAAKTSAQQALATAKANLTRAARGTTSKKQKATINPTVGTPSVMIGPDGKPVAIPPTVVNGSVPGAASAPVSSGSGGSASSTPQSSAGNASGTSAPVVPAGSGASGGNA